jgi:osmotically-inducible protein OsmY
MKQKALSLRTLAVAVTTACLLQACLPLFVAGVGTGVTSTLDRRTYGEQLNDREIEIQFGRRVTGKLDQNTSVSATAFHRWLLLTGQAIDVESRNELERIAHTVPNVQEVFNEVTVGYPTAFGNRSNDALLTSQVKARLFDSNAVSGHHVKVETEAGVVYLMGELTDDEAKVAVDIASHTYGVQKVVSIIEIISPERARELTMQGPSANSSAPASSR